jgi:hypothetical protein
MLHSRRYRQLLWAAALTTVGVSMLTGCASHPDGAPRTSAADRAPATPEAQPAADSAVGISTAGVTTKVDAPAESTEEEYFQACHAAMRWMDGQEGDRQALVEPYLAGVQAATATPNPGTFNTPWAKLTPGRQAAVIVAARAAAGQECG